MASRKEEKERLRQERIASERQASASARKRLMLGYLLAGALALAILVGIVVVISNAGGGGEDSENVNTDFGVLPEDLPVDEREGTAPPDVVNGDLVGAARTAGCKLQLDLKVEGDTHFGDVDKVVSYETQPPTSGDHYAADEQGTGALADGAYLETPNWNRALHALEHGRIQIQYSPDLPEDQQLELKGIFDAARPGVDLFPNADMPYEVAATAWTQLVGCETYEGGPTLDVLRDFRDRYLGQGPEGVPFE